MKWSRVKILGQEGQVNDYDGDKVMDYEVIIEFDDKSLGRLIYTPEFAADPCRLPTPTPGEGEAINKSSWRPTSWTPPRADFQPPQYHDNPGDTCRKCIEVCREIVADDWWDNIDTNEFMDYATALEQAAERAAKIEELNQEFADAARGLDKMKVQRDREFNKSRKATEELNRERSAHREEIAKYKKQQQADKEELRVLKKELRAGKKRLEDTLSSAKGSMAAAVSETTFDFAVNHIAMLQSKLGAMGGCTLQCTDLKEYQIKFLCMCEERQVALLLPTLDPTIMQWSDEMWENVLDDFREGLQGKCEAPHAVRFGNFIEERFPEIKFPWVRQNMSETNQAKFDAFLEAKGVCVCEDSSDEPAPAEGEDSSVDSSEDDEWDEICNHGDWSEPLLDYRNIADIEMLTYGGGPSGGYAMKAGQLYKWHQGWGTPKEMTK